MRAASWSPASAMPKCGCARRPAPRSSIPRRLCTASRRRRAAAGGREGGGGGTRTFIESRIPDAEQRELLYELSEIAAIAGEKMDIDTYTRLQRVQQNLMRKWGDPD